MMIIIISKNECVNHSDNLLDILQNGQRKYISKFSTLSSWRRIYKISQMIFRQWLYNHGIWTKGNYMILMFSDVRL